MCVAVLEGGIAQAVPEHPKRENIFSLSTACGDAYLFQVTAVKQSALCSEIKVTLQ